MRGGNPSGSLTLLFVVPSGVANSGPEVANKHFKDSVMLLFSRTALPYTLSTLLSAALFSPCLIAQDPPASLPDTDSAKALTNPTFEIESRQYPIAQIVARVQKEIGLSAEKSAPWLAKKLANRLGPSEEQTSGKSFGAVGDIELNAAGRGCKIEAGVATVICESEVHAAIEAYLRTLKEFGFRQVVIRTRVLRGPSEVILNKLPIDWEHIPTNSPFASDPGISDFTNGFATAHGEQPGKLETPAAVVSAGYLASPLATETAPAEDNSPKKDFAAAVSFVERSNPVFFSMLGDEQARAFVQAASVEPEIDLLLSPSVVVYDGQEGTVGDGVQRPFVVGIERKVASQGVSQTVTFQPKVKVYSEGTNIRLRPELLGDSIRLSCDLDICKIRKVETFQMPRFDGAGVFQVQIPEVATTKFRATRLLPKDFSMVVATLETDQEGKRSALVVMCQCSTLNLEKEAR